MKQLVVKVKGHDQRLYLNIWNAVLGFHTVCVSDSLELKMTNLDRVLIRPGGPVPSAQVQHTQM